MKSYSNDAVTPEEVAKLRAEVSRLKTLIFSAAILNFIITVTLFFATS